jgi:hypothetical protein
MTGHLFGRLPDHPFGSSTNHPFGGVTRSVRPSLVRTSMSHLGDGIDDNTNGLQR